MKCLLDALDSKTLVARLDPLCHQGLVLRRQLWSITAKRPDFVDWNLLVAQVNTNGSWKLVFVSLMAIVGFIFILGLCCGRVTKRTAISAKNR